jgi:hypothetical protein
MKISTVLDKIEEHQLFVPAFQREYVWKRDDAKQLIDSLIKEYPTGTMLTWETDKPPELKGPHQYNEKQGAVRILLDGQQRITTLYMLIRGTIPPYYKLAEIMNDTRGLYVNVETLELEYYSKAKMQHEPRWQNITDIFQRKVRAKDIVRNLEEHGIAVSKELDDRIYDHVGAIENIVTRDFPEQIIPVRASIREAIDIFYKVNASGVSLTDAELALAQISGYWPQARDIFKAKLTQLENQGFQFKLDFIVYILLGCLHFNGSEMKKLHGKENDEQIREAWNRLDTQVLDYVVNLMRERAYIDHSDEINSVYALIPIIVYVFHRHGNHLDDGEIRKLVKWFYYSQIRTRYISQLPQKLDRDLRVIKESQQPFDTLLSVIRDERNLKIEPEEFSGHGIGHPLFSLMRWYFKSRNAQCFTTGLGLRKNMGRKYQLENDHIFPYSKLKKAGYGKGNHVKYQLAQEMTNRAILTQVANRSKSDQMAEDYLKSIKHHFPKALALQSIPDDENLWKFENYELFLARRRAMLASELNAFLDNITATAPVTAPVSIEDLIAEGETDSLEFKSSLRWDYNTSTVNKKLEDVITKSVAAFTNSEGGTLLIGVNDAGAAIGLLHDYASLEGDRDKFERHLRGILNNRFGVAFVSTVLDISFPQVDGVEICQIEIGMATKPMVVTLKDNSGQPVERLYIRNGNASQEVPISEISSYLAARFPSPNPGRNINSGTNDTADKAQPEEPKESEDENTPSKQSHAKYWKSLIKFLQESGSSLECNSASSNYYQRVCSIRQNFRVGFERYARDGHIDVYIGSWDAEKIEELRRLQHDNQIAIEQEVGQKVEWSGDEDSKSFWISTELKVDPYDEKDWPRQHEWHKTTLEKLTRAVFRLIPK